MSTFCLDDQRFADLERTLSCIDYAGNGATHQLAIHGYNLDHAYRFGASLTHNPNNQEYEGIQRLIGVWRANNARAYHARYLHHEDVRKSRTYTWRFTRNYVEGKILEPIQLLKSLQCLRYNMDDHEDTTLNKIIDAVSSLVIHELPAYKNAAWG